MGKPVNEELKDAKIDGMADTHEIVYDSLQRCFDAINLVTEAQAETGKTDEKYSFAWGMLDTFRELFDESYYDHIGRLKNYGDETYKEIGESL
jgi:hypothetical protein